MTLDTRALRALGWTDPPQQTALIAGEVQLWLIKVPDAQLGIDALLARLTPAERDRAAAKRIPEKQREYVTGQAALRTLLARQLRIDPMQVDYRRGIKGKPYLQDTSRIETGRIETGRIETGRIETGRIGTGLNESVVNDPALKNTGHNDAAAPVKQQGLQFNITHSGELVMVAMALDTELGVDVEWHNERTDPHRVARRAFSKREQQALCNLPEHLQRAYFFALWTCKEALVKCTGLGIHSGMANFEIVFDDTGGARVKAAWDTQRGVDRLCVVPLKLGADNAGPHAGALVHAPPALSTRHWILDASPDPLQGIA